MLGLTEVAPRVWVVDVDQFGRPGQGAVYVLGGDRAALVESGTSLARDRILAGLDALGIPRGAVAWIFVTHVHLDHAGGAGALLPHLPNATVVAHERGAKHLVDPGRLVASVAAATGDRFPLYGTAVPVPEDRVAIAADGERFDLGRFVIRAVDAPGHAPHHLCFFEEQNRLLFTGDAAGLYLTGHLFPATVPPSFDLDASLATLNRLADLQPKALLYTHFGSASPDLLARYAHLLPAWVERVARLLPAHPDEAALIRAVLAAFVGEGWPAGDHAREDLAMSVRGAVAYLRRREGTA